MAYFDIQNLFSDKQVIGAAGTNLSTNVIDLGVAGAVINGSVYGVPVGPFGGTGGGKLVKDVGTGGSPNIVAQVTTTATGGTSVQVQLVQADDAALSSGAEVLQETGVVPLASLKAGYQFRLGAVVPHGVTKRFLGLKYVVVGVFTAGNITAGLATEPGVGQNYAGY